MRERLARGIIRGASGGSGGGGTTGTIDQYIQDVNAVRSSNLSTAQKTNLQDFWDRLGNSQGELSSDLTGDVLAAYTLRSTQNADQGGFMIGIVGPDLSLVNGPSFGTDGMVFDGTDQALDAGQSLVTSNETVTTLVVFNRGANKNQYLACQHDGGAGRVLFLTSGSNNDIVCGVAVGGSFKASGSGDPSGSGATWPSGSFALNASLVREDATDGLRTYDSTGSRHDSKSNDTTGLDYENSGYRIGNRQDGTRGVDGQVPFVIHFDANVTGDIGSLSTIYQQTIGQGLGL
jgi:hypothetical protein